MKLSTTFRVGVVTYSVRATYDPVEDGMYEVAITDGQGQDCTDDPLLGEPAIDALYDELGNMDREF